jgi:hypothetical protein
MNPSKPIKIYVPEINPLQQFDRPNDRSNWVRVGQPTQHGESQLGLRIVGGNRYLVTVGVSGSIAIWDVATQERIYFRSGKPDAVAQSFDVTASGEMFLAATDAPGQVTKLQLPRVLESEGFEGWFADWLETAGGWRLEEGGALEPLACQEIAERRKRIPDSRNEVDMVPRWAAWISARRADRPPRP